MPTLRILAAALSLALTLPAHASLERMFVFKYPAPTPGFLQIDSKVIWGKTVCSLPADQGVQPGTVCLVVGRYRGITISGLKLLAATDDGRLGELVSVSDATDYSHRRLHNDLSFVTPQQPFYAKYDLNRGKIYIGFNRAKLISFDRYYPAVD